MSARSAPPAIVLVRPQLPENIGAAARAMLNCGLGDLRLVRPRAKWPHARARAMAVGADRLLDAARLFDDVPSAIADLRYVLATTARPRDQVRPVLTPRAAAAKLRAHGAAGVLFGPERTGLENDEMALADALITVPLNRSFASLNLAQAVLLVAYEWFQADDPTPGRRLLLPGKAAPAKKRELDVFFERLEDELGRCGFLRNSAMRPTMVRNIRNMFLRAELTEQEVRTLHGIVTGLTRRPHALGDRSAISGAADAEAGIKRRRGRPTRI
ncbi:MAG TPA: RNA methyltransferase [Alphaproteobacteria bacterium]|nr:RNA methyltransferase [Alphaproteobacteria bacterium]